MTEQVKYSEVKVIQMDNGTMLHSWVIGLSYFHREALSKDTEKDTAEAKGQTNANVN